MTELADNLHKIFKDIRPPQVDQPWGEIHFNEEEQLFVNEFVNIIDNIPRFQEEDQPIIFRGQKNSCWTLQPKLFRLWENKLKNQSNGFESALHNALASEYDSIRYFQQRSHLYLEPAKILSMCITWGNIGNWIALMQHYGAPTRFLDWTSSFHVALYFAVEDDTADGAVWVLSTKEHIDCMDEYVQRPDQAEGEKIVKDCNSYIDFGLKAPSRIEIFASELPTERIVSQRGVFTFSYQLFEDHVSASSLHFKEKGYQNPILHKFIIPSKMKKKIREKLAKINICAETLFPGIDGLGKSIHEKMELFIEVFHSNESK